MNRIALRTLVGAATLTAASTVLVGTAYAATAATLTIKVSDKPIVSSVTGAVVHDGVISATASVAGTVAFSTAADTSTAGTPIKGCDAVATTAAAPFVAMCTPWQPAAPGKLVITAKLTPTDTTIAPVSATLAWVVGKPINEYTTNGDISLYVDTVNGSSTPVSLSNGSSGSPYVASGGCLLMNQFMQGQQIVFRVYANDYARGGVPLTGNDAQMQIKIAGWDTPVAMSYGDHSGTAFWAGAINTGVAGSGKYSALGTVQYTINITLLEKPAVTKDIMVTKYVKVVNAKTKKAVKVNGAYVWKPVKVKTTQIVTPAVVAKTLTFSPAAWQAAASVLTLSAAKA